jgi:hypothetical protein
MKAVERVSGLVQVPITSQSFTTLASQSEPRNVNLFLIFNLFFFPQSRSAAGIQAKRRDLEFLAFWLSNISILLFYLKRDPGTLTATPEYQVMFSEVVLDIYQHYTREGTRRLAESRCAAQGLVLHDFIKDVQVQLEPIKGAARGRTTSGGDGLVPGSPQMNQAANPGASAANTQPPPEGGPGLVIYHLQQILDPMRNQEVHPKILSQALGQLLHALSALAMETLLAVNSGLCHRWRAVQLRMNVSQIQEWITSITGDASNPASAGAASAAMRALEPLVQTAQLLQVLTRLGNAEEFNEIARDLNALSPAQVLRLIQAYRYEAGEPRINKDVLKTAETAAAGARKPGEDTPSPAESRDASRGPTGESRFEEEDHRFEGGQAKGRFDPWHLQPFMIPPSHATLADRRIGIPEDVLMVL